VFLLVQEMAATGARIRVLVAVACRVLGFNKQAYYQWQKQPVSAREREEVHLIGVLRRLHEEDEEGGYRVDSCPLERSLKVRAKEVFFMPFGA
jgi:putative transposase